MKFILNNDKLKIQEPECKNSGSINYYLVDVEFNEEWEGLNIEGRLTPKEGSCCNNDGRAIAVINNKLFIDNSINGYYAIGFIGFKVKYVLTQDTTIDLNKTYYTRSGQEGSYVYTKVENPVIADISNYYEAIKDYQISTNLQGIWFNQGAGEIEVTNDDIPTPSQWEIYIEQIQNMIDGLEGLIPTKLSQLQNDNHTVQDENYVHTDNNFTNKDKDKLDSLENYDDTKIKDDIQEINGDIEEINTNLLNYSLITETGSKIDLEINSSTYELVAKLYDKNNNLISTSRKIDLPIESMIVGGLYDKVNKKIILTLDNGNTIDIPVGDLISGLQAEITSENKLESDLVDDSNQTNKFVTTQEKEMWNEKLDEEDLADYVKNTDYASSSRGGVFKTSRALNVDSSGLAQCDTRTYAQYQNADNFLFISKGTLENVIIGKQLINETTLEDSQEVQNAEIELIKQQIPTETSEGQSITLNDSSNMPFEEFGIEGNTEQATRSGKNLLPIVNITRTINGITYTVNNDGTITVNGTATDRSVYPINVNSTSISKTIDLEANTNYCLSKTSNQSTSGITFQGYLSKNDSDFYPQGSFTTSEATKIGVYLLIAKGITINNVILKLQLEKDSTTSDWEQYGASPSPDYPSPVNTITGDVEVKVQNGNLYNDNFDDYIRPVDYRICPINLEIGKSYTIKATLKGTEITGVVVGFVPFGEKYADFSSKLNICVTATGSSLTRTLNITDEWTSPKLVVFASDRETFNSIFENYEIQLVEGTSAGECIPHQEQNYPISLGDIELCKIGEYQDKIFKAINGNTVYDSLTSEQKAGLTYGNWYKYGAVGKYVFTGQETFTFGAGQLITTHLMSIIKKPATNGTVADIKSNKYKPVAKWYSATENSMAVDVGGNIYINNPNWTSVSDGQTGIVGTILYYALETPVITQITDTTLINQLNALEQAYTYKGVTHIDTDVETKPYLKVVYRKDIGLILERIENLEARVSLLE